MGAAIGFMTSEPTPVFHKMGIRLARTTHTVINFGLRRLHGAFDLLLLRCPRDVALRRSGCSLDTTSVLPSGLAISRTSTKHWTPGEASDGSMLWLSALSDERKTWSRRPYRRRDIQCLPMECRRRASRRKGFPQTLPKRLCREPWWEVHLPQHRKAT